MKIGISMIVIGVFIITFNDRLARAQEDQQRELWGEKYKLSTTKLLTIAAGATILAVGIGTTYFEYTLK